jgi:retron-type reverse transcriptase
VPHKIKNLWPSIACYEGLLNAWKEVRSGKGTKDLVLKYESNLACNLSRLESRLLSGEYKPKRHYEFQINDPKPRLIQAPALTDRIVQHSVCNALRTPIQQRLISTTYSCLIGKGTHAASNQLQEYLKDNQYRYYLSLDISKFFYSIDHHHLLVELDRVLACRKTFDLLELFITANGTGKGIPIGASTSQILANLALNPVDHFAKRVLKSKTYLRYCDDMMLLFPTASEANRAYRLLDEQVQLIGFQLNSKSGVGAIADGVDWVGYRHWKNYKIIRKRALKRIKQKAKHDCSLETVMAYLSHAKDTASLHYVSSLLWNFCPQYHFNIEDWLFRHSTIKPKDLNRYQALPIFC